MASVLFMPIIEFGPVSIDGINHVRFVPGKDENNKPFVYEIPEHLAKLWEKREYGKIVQKQEFLTNADGTPINQGAQAQQSVQQEDEILQAPKIGVAANQQPLGPVTPPPVPQPQAEGAATRPTNPKGGKK